MQEFVRKDDSQERKRIDKIVEEQQAKKGPTWLYEPDKKRDPSDTPNEGGINPESNTPTFELVFEGRSYQIPADFNQDTSVFLLPDGRILTYDTIRGDVPSEDDLQVAEKVSDVNYPGTDESLAGLSKEELKQKLASVGRTIVEAK